MVEELFRALFEEEQHITSHEVRLKAGVGADLDQAEVTDWLNSDKGGKEVDQEVVQAQLQEIYGVPNFTIQGEYRIGGAQDPKIFVRLFNRYSSVQESTSR